MKFPAIVHDLVKVFAGDTSPWHDHGITKQLFDERLTSHRKKAHAHPVIGEYYEQLLELFDTPPEYFYSEKTTSQS